MSSADTPRSSFAAAAQDWTRYRDIVIYRTLAGLKSESRQYYLGYLWLLLEPGVNTLVFYIVLKLMKREDASIIGLLMGTIPWQWFESSVIQGMTSIRGKLHIYNHFHLPKYLFPIVSVITSTWKFCCVYFVVLLIALLAGFGHNWWMLTLPAIIVAQMLVILGCTLPLAILTTYFNDAITVMSSFFRILFFLSGIFFTGDDVRNYAGPEVERLFYLNPMAGLIQSYRDVVVNARAPDVGVVLYAMGFGLFFIFVGVVWSRRVDGTILKAVHA